MLEKQTAQLAQLKMEIDEHDARAVERAEEFSARVAARTDNRGANGASGREI